MNGFYESYSFCVKKGITIHDDLQWRGYLETNDCIIKYYTDPNCLGWLHHKQENYCFNEIFVTSPGEWDGPDLTNIYCAMERNCYTDGILAYYWSWMDNVRTTSADECHRFCRSTLNCGNWRYKDNICQLYNLHMEQNSFWDSGSRPC